MNKKNRNFFLKCKQKIVKKNACGEICGGSKRALRPNECVGRNTKKSVHYTKHRWNINGVIGIKIFLSIP